MIDAENRRNELSESQYARTLEEQKAQRLASLAANPYSFMEYNAAAGKTPTVQPWMLPLQRGDYGWQTGQPVPSTTVGDKTTYPELTKPSEQLWGRMSPTAQGQYTSYQTAATGAPNADVEWMRRASAPPSGTAPRLYWQ
jgi:hypothetical protein